MSKVDIWMPWYIAEYQADTMHLDPPQDCAYRRLLEYQWKKRQPLPNQMSALMNITKVQSCFFVDASNIPQACLEEASSIGRASASDDERMLYAWHLDILRQFFHQNVDGTWSQLRLEREMRKWSEKGEVAANRSRRAAWGRWHPGEPFPGDAPSIAQGKHEQSPSPSPKNYLKTSTNGSLRSPARISSVTAPESGSARSAPVAPRNPPRKPSTPENASPARRNPSVGPSGASAANDAPSTARKLVATDTLKASQPSKSKPDADPRSGVFRGELFRYWEEVNEVKIDAGLMSRTPPWGPRDRRELAAWLRAHPDGTVEMLRASLMHRVKSDRVNHTEPFYKWIRDVVSYSSGPLDQYKMAIGSVTRRT